MVEVILVTFIARSSFPEFTPFFCDFEFQILIEISIFWSHQKFPHVFFWGCLAAKFSEAAMDLLVLAQHGSNKEARAALMLGSQRYDAGLPKR